MANRYGYASYVTAVPETSYGARTATELALTGAVHMFDVTYEIKNEPILTDTKIKTGTTQPKIKEKIITGTGGTAIIKGNLCSEYEFLLKALTHDASSPYTMQEATETVPSYNLIQFFAVGTSGDQTPYDIATGAVLTSLKITGEANGIVQFESTWRCQAVDEGITTAVTNEPTAWGAGTPFLFGNVTATLFSTATTMNSFALNFDKVLADDRISYQNSMDRTAEYLLGFTGTVEVETIYNTTTDPALDGNIGSQTAVNNLITLANASKTWAFTTSNRIASHDKADPDKSLYVSKYVLDVAGDDDTAALSVTVTTL